MKWDNKGFWRVILDVPGFNKLKYIELYIQEVLRIRSVSPTATAVDTRREAYFEPSRTSTMAHFNAKYATIDYGRRKALNGIKPISLINL